MAKAIAYSHSYWEWFNKTLAASQAVNYAMCSPSNGIVLAGSGGSGGQAAKIQRSKYNGDIWVDIGDMGGSGASGDLYIMHMVAMTSSTILAATGHPVDSSENGGYILRSTDAGLTWTASSQMFTGQGRVHMLLRVSDTVAICGSGNGSGVAAQIRVSTDAGANWNAAITVGTTSDTQISSAAYLGTSGGKHIVLLGEGQGTGHIFKASFNSDWTLDGSIIDLGAVGSQRQCLSMLTISDGVAIIGTEAASGGGHVYKISNYADYSTLTDIGRPGSMQALYCFERLSATRIAGGGTTTTGTGKAVFIESTDNGTTWMAYTGIGGMVRIQSMASDDNYVWCGMGETSIVCKSAIYAI